MTLEKLNRFFGKLLEKEETLIKDVHNVYFYKLNIHTSTGNHSSVVPFDVNTWLVFGMLWRWAMRQRWWIEFLKQLNENKSGVSIETYWINPVRFAQELYKYLNKKN